MALLYMKHLFSRSARDSAKGRNSEYSLLPTTADRHDPSSERDGGESLYGARLGLPDAVTIRSSHVPLQDNSNPLATEQQQQHEAVSNSPSRSPSTEEKTPQATPSSPPWANYSRLISDSTIGLSDGLTVPFALTAGLSALGDSKLVVLGGMAELIAGAISMGMGGYLGAEGEAACQVATRRETQTIVREKPEKARALVRDMFVQYQLPSELLGALVGHFDSHPGQMARLLLGFHHGTPSDPATCATGGNSGSNSSPSRSAYLSGLTISTSYFVGGFMPLLPYIFIQTIETAFMWSVLVMVVALFVFGSVKTRMAGETGRWQCARGGVQMMILGSLAAGAAMGCVMLLGRG